MSTPKKFIVSMPLCTSGRFAFIELRTAALAVAALHLDKIELCGRQLNIGRPKGYEEPAALKQQARLNAAQTFAAQLSGGPTNCVLLEGLMDAGLMRMEEERREVRIGQRALLLGAVGLKGGSKIMLQLFVSMPERSGCKACCVCHPMGLMSQQNACDISCLVLNCVQLYDDVYIEAVKCGGVAGLVIPVPPSDIPDTNSCRVYVRFSNQDGASKCKNAMDGRQFDENKVRASFITEQDFYRAQAGEWL